MLRRQSCLVLALSAFASLLTTKGQTTPVPAEATSAVLEGRVVDAITSAPIAGAQLRMVPVHNAWPPDLESPQVRYGQSDEQGRFEFADLETGNYELGARAAGYRAGYEQGGSSLIQLFGSDRIVGFVCSRCGAEVSEAGHHMDEAGVLRASVTVRMMPKAVIVGRVTDPLGNPMPGARVSAFKAEGGEGGARATTANRPGPSLEAQADDRGEFRLAHLDEGRYFLVASQWLMRGLMWQQDYRITYFPHAVDPDAAQAVAASPGKTVRADIQIGRSTGVKVSGRVIPPSSAVCPVNMHCSTRVGLTPRPATDVNMRGGLITSAVQADNGFEIAGVLPGAYMLQAVTQARRMDEPSGGRPAPIQGVFRRVEVGAGGLGPVDLELKPLNEIAGSITFAEGCPRTGLWISASDEAGVLSSSTDVKVPAGETMFTLTGMGPGRVMLTVMPAGEGGSQARVESIRLGDQEVSKGGFDYPTNGTPALQIRMGCSPQGGTAQ